jgi:hypothetical protein
MSRWLFTEPSYGDSNYAGRVRTPLALVSELAAASLLVARATMDGMHAMSRVVVQRGQWWCSVASGGGRGVAQPATDRTEPASAWSNEER